MEGIIITSRLYHTILAALQTTLPTVRPSQHESLGLVMTGVARSLSGHLGKIARNLPLRTRQDSKEQRIRRLLENERITPATHYQPAVRVAIAGLVRQPVHLIIDRVLLHNRHNLLVVGLAFRRRVVPLVWRRLPHLGTSSLENQKALLREAAALLPPDVRITLHGDSEFGSQPLVAFARKQGWAFFLGLRGAVLVREQPKGQAQVLQERVRPEDGIVYLNGVYLTEDRIGPTNLYAWWSKSDRGQPMLRAVQSSVLATPHAYRIGKRRMWIEPTFREWESNGFGLETSGLVPAERFERLLIPLLLVYLWFTALGRHITQRGWRHLVDDGPPGARVGQWGLFHRGVGWFQRCLSLEDPPPPVMFYMSP